MNAIIIIFIAICFAVLIWGLLELTKCLSAKIDKYDTRPSGALASRGTEPRIITEETVRNYCLSTHGRMFMCKNCGNVHDALHTTRHYCTGKCKCWMCPDCGNAKCTECQDEVDTMIDGMLNELNEM